MSAALEHSITELFDGLTVGQTIQINIDHKDLSINMIGCWNSMCFSQSKGFNTEMRSQGIVADIMEQYSRHNRVDSTILLGDNHYYNEGDGTNEAKITEKDNIDAGLRCFENIYNKDGKIEHTFFALFGNHDIVSQKMIEEQIKFSSSKRWIMPQLFYNVIYTLSDETRINILFIDTNMFDDGYVTEKKNKREKLLDNAAKEKYKQKQIEWINKTLLESTCNVNIVCGHIPVFAYGHKTTKPNINNMELNELLLRHRNKINMYMCADEHNFQYNYDVNNDFHLFVLGSGPLGGADTAIVPLDKLRSVEQYMYDIGPNQIVHPYIQFAEEKQASAEETPPQKNKMHISDELRNVGIQNQFTISAPAFMNMKISKYGIRVGFYTINHVLDSCYGCSLTGPGSYTTVDKNIALFYEKYMPIKNIVLYIDNPDNFTLENGVYEYKGKANKIPYVNIHTTDTVAGYNGGNKNKKYKLKF